LLLDAGDVLNGEEGIGLATKGKALVEAMNMMKYDAMALGSGDFVIGLDLLKERMKTAQFPMLSANAVLSDTGELIAQPYIIKDLGQDYRAAIIGLTDPDVTSLSLTTQGPVVRTLDPAETVKKIMAEVSGKANAIIVLSHLGSQADRELAQTIPGIAAIIGGKSGEIMPPTQVGPSHTVLVQAGSQGKYLGELRLTLGEAGQLMAVEGEEKALEAGIPDDPAMAKFVEEQSKLLGPTAVAPAAVE
jgi:5'-nucleotidase / UDP-sugar diphosphatase